jgi:hypothetical protein
VKLIEGIELSNLCDYSFGEQSGSFSNIYTHFMTPANLLNLQFVEKVLSMNKDYMTLFIDNIRLYNREIKDLNPQDKIYVDSLMEENDLLDLCSKFSDKKFIIFTNLEDTPIDEIIFDRIPENVLSVNVVNAVNYGGKVKPFPYGIQRRLSPNDNRYEVLLSFIQNNESIECKNLLYVNHSVNTNPKERGGIGELFLDKSWAMVEEGTVDYFTYLSNLKESKFMICPIGNAIDCHRNWEVLYMKRVPVMKKHPYLEELFKDYPVLFVEKYSDIDENLLLSNEFLFDNMQQVDIKKLDLNQFYDRIVYNSLKRDD